MKKKEKLTPDQILLGLKSRAKTAWGHLLHVRRLIEAEPKRYDQGDWIDRKTNDSLVLDEAKQHQKFPACGTVGCLAGWTVISLTGHNRFRRPSVRGHAERALGLTNQQAVELFDGNAVNNTYYNDQIARGLDPDYGADIPGQTKRHLKFGLKHLDAFMKKYKKQLKATKLDRSVVK